MRETTKELKHFCVVFLFAFVSAAESYEVLTLRNMSNVYDVADKFEIPAPVCACVSCALLGGHKLTGHNKSCSCVCSAIMNTFGTFGNRMGCFNPRRFIEEEGCDILFYDTPPLRIVEADSLHLLTIAETCWVQNVQYLTCLHEWVSTDSSQVNQFVIKAVQGPSHMQEFALQVSPSVSKDLGGKIIKLDVKCSNRVTSTCLMFKFKGQTRCNISVGEPTPNTTPALSMAPPTGSPIQPVSSNPSTLPTNVTTELVTSFKKLSDVTVPLLSSTMSSVAINRTRFTEVTKPSSAATILATSATVPKLRNETLQNRARDRSLDIFVASGIVGAAVLIAFGTVLVFAVRRRHFRKFNLTRETSRGEIGEENHGATIADYAHVEVIDNRRYNRQEQEMPPSNQDNASAYATIGMSIPKKESKVEDYEFLGKNARRTSNGDYARLYNTPTTKRSHMQQDLNKGADLSKGEISKNFSEVISGSTHDCVTSKNPEYQVLEGPDPNNIIANEPTYHVLECPAPNLAKNPEYQVLGGPDPNNIITNEPKYHVLECLDPTLAKNPDYQVLEGPDPNKINTLEPTYHILECPDPNMEKRIPVMSCNTSRADPLHFVLEKPEANVSISSNQQL